MTSRTFRAATTPKPTTESATQPAAEREQRAPAQHDSPAHSAATGTSPAETAAQLNQASGGQLARAGDSLLQLQQQHGNRYVQQVMAQAGQLGPQAGEAAAPIIQTKLALGPAGDSYEQEADRAAATVGSGGNVHSGGPGVSLRRGPSAGDGAVDPAVESGIKQARGGGQPLPEGVRASMEQNFGADFSGVRVHADGQADTLNQALQARAFTTGPDIFFRRGEYRPASAEGQGLLAHELSHVVQQGAVGLEQAGQIEQAPGETLSPMGQVNGQGVNSGAGVVQRLEAPLDQESTRLVQAINANAANVSVSRMRNVFQRLNLATVTQDEDGEDVYDNDAFTRIAELKEAMESHAMEIITPMARRLLTDIKWQLTRTLRRNTPRFVTGLPDLPITEGEETGGGVMVTLDGIYIGPKAGIGLVLNDALDFAIAHEVGHLVSHNLDQAHWGNLLKTDQQIQQSNIPIEGNVNEMPSKYEEVRADIFGGKMLAGYLGVNANRLNKNKIISAIDAESDAEHPSFDERKRMLNHFLRIRF
jgi:hypothetical protein